MFLPSKSGGGTLKRVNCGSYDSRNAYTVNIANYISDTKVLANLSNVNFGLLVTGMRCQSSSAKGTYANIFDSYNASTYKVSLKQSMDYISGTAIGYCLYTLYCWYVE